MSSQTLEGRFGQFGGRYVPETLVAALDELASAWKEAVLDPAFNEELAHQLPVSGVDTSQL